MENSSRKKKGLDKSCGARRGSASRAAACPRPTPQPRHRPGSAPPAPGRAEPLLPGPAGSAPSSPVPPGEPHTPCGTRCVPGRTLETLLNPSWAMAVMKARVSSKRLATSATSRVPLRERLRCEGWHCKTPRPPPSLPAITHNPAVSLGLAPAPSPSCTHVSAYPCFSTRFASSRISCRLVPISARQKTATSTDSAAKGTYETPTQRPAPKGGWQRGRAACPSVWHSHGSQIHPSTFSVGGTSSGTPV